MNGIGSIFDIIAFAIFALVSIGFSLVVVTAKDIVRAAMSLVVTLFSVAALYILLNAQFLGVVQVLVYVGAIAVLILFAVMLTKKDLGSGIDGE